MSTLSGHSTQRRATLLSLYKAMHSDDDSDDIGLTPAEIKEMEYDRAEEIAQARADNTEWERGL